MKFNIFWRFLYIFLVFLFLFNGVIGCTNTNDKKEKEKIVSLESKYDKKFEMMNTGKSDLTIAGRKITNSYLMKSVEDGIIFKYTINSDGKIDDSYLPMKFGNDYFKNELKQKLDDRFGAENYVCQVILIPGEVVYVPKGIEDYKYQNDSQKIVKVFIAKKTEKLDKKAESYKVFDIYNDIKNIKSKSIQIGYMQSIPKDITNFLVLETNGLQSAFSSFYANNMNGELNVLSELSVNTLKQNDIEKMIITNYKD